MLPTRIAAVATKRKARLKDEGQTCSNLLALDEGEGRARERRSIFILQDQLRRLDRKVAATSVHDMIAPDGCTRREVDGDA